MTPLDILTTSIRSLYHHLQASLPADCQRALLDTVRLLDQLPPSRPATTPLQLALGMQRPDLGGQLALRLLLESAETAQPAVVAPDPGPTAQDRLLAQCHSLATATLLRLHAEAGYMRLEHASDGSLHAWINRTHLPARLRERADFEWLRAAQANSPGVSTDPVPVYRLDYPAETVLGSTTAGIYQAIVERLLDRTHATGASLTGTPMLETDLAGSLAHDLGAPTEAILHALQPLTLTAENAQWHSTLPGVTGAPLVRLSPDHVIVSRHGLTNEPFLFLTRELRRQDASAYHDVAHHREDAFRADLYGLFSDRRFIQAASRIVLRCPGGTVRTDIDAAIFDRRTGTLALFELKSPDPFARTSAEFLRQRDSVLYANRQVSGVLNWINRYGGDDILNRIDRRTARTFRVQRVLPFVLCRYLARFDDGPAPDSRAAWASWGAVIRSAESSRDQAMGSNPLQALFNRLTGSSADPILHGDTAPVKIEFDTLCIRVFPAAGDRR